MNAIQKGFTLIELMVTLVVLGVLLGLGVPTFTAWVQDSRLDTSAQTISSLLKQTRSEAVARQNVVTLDWSGGEVDIYTDNDGDGDGFEAGDTSIKAQIRLSADGVDIINDDTNSFISFNPNGTLNEVGAIEIGICDSRGATDGWTININTVGRVSMTQVGVDCDPS